uniref:Solute carrier family 25 member 40 n=1 Tax=Echinostoma caproni TaxID=27848 RepID=A0A183BEU3_9TREM
LLDAVFKIIRNEGLPSLWSGLSPTLIMALPQTVIYFTINDWLKEPMNDHNRTWYLPNDWTPAIIGGASRVFAVVAISPLELLRTKMQSFRMSPGHLKISSVETRWIHSLTVGLDIRSHSPVKNNYIFIYFSLSCEGFIYCFGYPFNRLKRSKSESSKRSAPLPLKYKKSKSTTSIYNIGSCTTVSVSDTNHRVSSIAWVLFEDALLAFKKVCSTTRYGCSSMIHIDSNSVPSRWIKNMVSFTVCRNCFVCVGEAAIRHASINPLPTLDLTCLLIS